MLPDPEKLSTSIIRSVRSLDRRASSNRCMAEARLHSHAKRKDKILAGIKADFSLKPASCAKQGGLLPDIGL